MKISLIGAELFYANGSTDMMKLTIAFHNFKNTPKKHNGMLHNLQAHYSP